MGPTGGTRAGGYSLRAPKDPIIVSALEVLRNYIPLVKEVESVHYDPREGFVINGVDAFDNPYKLFIR